MVSDADLQVDEVVRIVAAHVERQFPKRCSACGVVYATARGFVGTVEHVGLPVSYDAEIGNWRPSRPLGAVGLSNCPCGNTMGISSRGMKLRDLWKVLAWLRRESKRTGDPVPLLFNGLRKRVDERIMAPPQLESLAR